MVSIEEMKRMLSALLDELPAPLFEGLNGGVSLLEEERPDPGLSEVYVLGEYVQDLLGSSIVLYYGSFAQVFGDATRSAMEKELRKTLRHEFRHHIEAMAGADDLDVEDARRMEEYRREDEAYRRGKPEAKK
ncbi:MAG: metallopeptidase family protein [Oscillospiraceae bacterium]|nr:metallopeptidase family protein [Oscillospiraceae bacterium]MCM0708606.1 metallopeptidase family protein [Faecalicatena sp. BF-R-105]MDY3218989.1 metallopeptidase family protein [Candidatus Fimivivens sp.]SFJ18685.1 Zinicin-like metallopeptidase [Ruminococcaceae bacterium D5]GKH51443.1 hypothetical protein CE91St46_25540 [Eubacteriales bacterium]